VPPRVNADVVGVVTVSVKLFVAIAPTLSPTVILKLKSPTVVGVPESVLVPEKLKPAGALPPGVKRYGGTPPVAPKVKLIAEPVGTGLVGPPVMTSGAGWITIVKPRAPLTPLVSDVATVKENCPGTVGVPVTEPPPERLRPSGRFPPANEKLYGPLPPLAPSEPEYGTPTVPTGRFPVGETWGAGDVTPIPN
jgi:hypothetical protein